tara:strand:+ start:781 stop:1077 length:297 start_codon:yes stop_codon:yes gene_type:complete
VKLKKLISELNKISKEYNHSNPDVVIRLGEDVGDEILDITDVADVYACNEAMGCSNDRYDNCLNHPNHKDNDDCFVNESRIDDDNQVSRLFEIEITAG